MFITCVLSTDSHCNTTKQSPSVAGAHYDSAQGPIYTNRFLLSNSNQINKNENKTDCLQSGH